MCPLSNVEMICNEVVRSCCPQVLEQPMPVPVEEVMERHYHLNPRPVTLIPDNSILGETIFENGYRTVWECRDGDLLQETISVSRGDILLDEYMFCNMPEKTAFTIAHELGHWQLHQGLFSGEYHQGAVDGRRWEREANGFAEALFLPRGPVRLAAKAVLEEQGADWRCFRRMRERENQIAFLRFSEAIAKIFCVSRDTARYWMQKLFCIQ